MLIRPNRRNCPGTLPFRLTGRDYGHAANIRDDFDSPHLYRPSLCEHECDAVPALSAGSALSKYQRQVSRCGTGTPRGKT
jgi:hypothetical protein